MPWIARETAEHHRPERLRVVQRLANLHLGIEKVLHVLDGGEPQTYEHAIENAVEDPVELVGEQEEEQKQDDPLGQLFQEGHEPADVDPWRGYLLHEIAMPYPFVTNVNFAGDDESTLFVTVETDANNPDWIYSGKLYRVVTDW